MLTKLKDYINITLGAIILAIGVYFFKLPNNFAVGGVSGLAVILTKIIPVAWLTKSLWITILNVVLLIVGFIFVNKQFGVKTIYCTLLFSGLSMLFENIFPVGGELLFNGNATLTDNALLELCFVILLSAFSSAILFHADASSGGTDIIAMIIKKYSKINVGRALLVADIIVALSSFFVINVEIGLYSVLGLFAKCFLVDGIMESFNMCKFFTIVTDKPDEICDYIMQNMHHGVTKMHGEGAFSHTEKTVLLTVCRKYEALLLRKALRRIDPSAFVMVTSSSEILGKGFRTE